jgi:hypothetical protein
MTRRFEISKKQVVVLKAESDNPRPPQYEAAQACAGERGGPSGGSGNPFRVGDARLTAPGSDHLGFLKNNSIFQQIQQVILKSPQMLKAFLQQIGASNPKLGGLIGQHPEEFLQLLTEDGDNAAPLTPGDQAISGLGIGPVPHRQGENNLNVQSSDG